MDSPSLDINSISEEAISNNMDTSKNVLFLR